MARGGKTGSNLTEYKKSYSRATSGRQSAKSKKTDNTKHTDERPVKELKEKKGLSMAAAVMIGIITAIILELSNFNILGKIGGWIKYAQFGLFGSMAYVFPIGVLLLFIAIALKRKKKRYIISGIFLFIFACSFTHLLSSHSLNNQNVLSYFKNCAESGTGGGITGGAIAFGLYTLLSQTGAVIINILIIILCLFFLFENQIRSLFAYIFSGNNQPEEYDEEYQDVEELYDRIPYEPARSPAAGRNRTKKDKDRDQDTDTVRNKDNRRRDKDKDRDQEEPVYISEDDEGTVIRLVHTGKKRRRSKNVQLVRINKKAQPMRDGNLDTVRSGNKVKGISEQLDMLPRNANGDEIHEITRAARGKTVRKASAGKTGNMFANTVIPKEKNLSFDDVPDIPAPVMDIPSSDIPYVPGKEAAVTRVKEAAVNRRAKAARPVKVHKDESIPGQQVIRESEIESRDLRINASGNNNPGSRVKINEPADLNYDARINDMTYSAPPMNLLARVKAHNRSSEAELEKIARDLELILEQFGVHATVVEIQAGPSVTRFELVPELGTRVSKITSLSDDLKLNLGVTEIRIEAPIPGRQAVGIEIPNKTRQTVYMRELLEEPALISHPSKLAFAAGKDISGNVVVADIAKMPHLLVAGTTGSGKSVFLNTILMTILYRAKPSEVGLIIIDPKKVEFGVYAGIPHLMKDVVTDPGQAVSTLRWAVNEMSKRYERMQWSAVRDFKSYNAKVENGTVSAKEENPRKMNQIVIIIDELADLMMVAKKEAESMICRIAQLARAAGIHLIIATQRPSVDVVTGLIKANVPARVALLVSSQIDSRTIIDMPGAEKLLGNGDMLFYPTGYVKPQRVQGAFVSDEEIQKTVDYLIQNNKNDYFSAESQEIEKFMNSQDSDPFGTESGHDGDSSGKYDEFFYEAGKLCIELGKASSSMLQRRFSLGFNRAARIIEQLEEFGAVGPQNGAKPRQILVDVATFENMYQSMVEGKK